MLGLGPTELLLILGLLIVVFGARKIPLIARGLGEGIRNFKGAVKTEDGSIEPGPGDGDRRDD